jgi:hypothetical protein
MSALDMQLLTDGLPKSEFRERINSNFALLQAFLDGTTTTLWEDLEGSAQFINYRGVWAPGVEYVYTPGTRRDAYRDPVSGAAYVALITHTSTTIEQDRLDFKVINRDAVQVLVELADVGTEIVKNADTQVSTLAALAAYTGSKNRVHVTGVLGGTKPQGVAGVFLRMDGDTTSAANGGTIVVDALGRRWHREGWSVNNLNVGWFGAVGNGASPTADTAAFVAARNVLQGSGAHRGGVLVIPAGVFMLTQTINFTADVSGVHNIYIRGAGGTATYLNFVGAPALSDGISFNKGAHFGVSGLTITSAPRDAISMVGGALGTDDFMHMGFIEHVRAQFCGRDGLLTQNSFMLTIEDFWSFGHARNGATFMGFHTSLHVRRSWASGCAAGIGWAINGCVYSKFEVLGADDCDRGYSIANCQGVSFDSCGSERAGKESFFLYSSDASAVGIPTIAHDIAGVSFNNCYALEGNNTGAAGANATFMSLLTANNRPIKVSVNGCWSKRKNVTDPAIFANGASGRVSLTETAPSYDGNVTSAGTVRLIGRNLNWTPVLKGQTTAGVASGGTIAGTYRLQGEYCEFDAELSWTGHTGTGGMFIDGLPVPAIAGWNAPCQIAASDVAMTGVPGAYVESNSSLIRLTQTPIGGTSSFITIDTAGTLRVSGRYKYQ